MTDKQMVKLMKRNKKRRAAQGIGAAFGTLTSLAVLGLLFPDYAKEVADKLAKK